MTQDMVLNQSVYLMFNKYLVELEDLNMTNMEKQF
jgi:hypothetical protein